jgi:AraC-like DNA-binding protein
LTPLEQRQWIEMLEKRDIQAIRQWMEQEFLEYTNPYPPPEMIRIRMTSVLAQVRRYMKSQQLGHSEWETAYHEVFRQIIQEPVVYRIVQSFLSFTTRLLTEKTGRMDADSKTLVEKVKSLMESNYWDPQWNLESCAEALRIHKSTLSRRFSAESGKTFRDTLHEIKIREAKRLLKETDLPLDEIARLVGYHHRTYFNAKFKQLENKTPKQFRMGL